MHDGGQERLSDEGLTLVTGATAGLGVGVAERLASQGHHVVITHRPGGTLPDATLARLHRYDTTAASYPLDFTEGAHIAAIVDRIRRERGAITRVVHCVGPMQIARVAKSTLAMYADMVTTNLMSAVALTLAVLPDMRAHRFGRLLFFGMTGSSVTRPARGLASYGAAKAALVAFARTVALEEAHHGITVNVIEPGDIREKSRSRVEAWSTAAGNPSGHAGSWEDVADAVAFLLDQRAGFINGGTLAVGGGLIDASE